MGRGSSSASRSGGRGSGARAALPPNDFPEAFKPGQDLQATGDVDHSSRTVTRSLQRDWNQFTAAYQSGMTSADEQIMSKDFDWRTGDLYGYVRTSNSFKINEALYDPKNDGKSDSEIFTRRDRNGNLRDLQTVQTMDRAISTHVTQADASYTRFSSAGAIQSTYGLSDTQMSVLSGAASMDAGQLATLNAAMGGKSSFSKAYTSVSANRSMNAFGGRNSMRKGYTFERKINIPKGTNAFAVQFNAQESEVIFGRRMQTQLTHVTVASDGHIVLHEQFIGYK